MLVDVALPLPLFRTFTYEVADDDARFAQPGTRVVVPFHGRKQLGVIVGPGAELPAGVIAKQVLRLPDDRPVLDEQMLKLARWIATYYVAPLGVVLRAALPAALTGANAPVPNPKTRRVLVQTGELPSLMARDKTFARAPKQRALFEALESLGGRSDVAHLTEQLGFSSAVVNALVKTGLASIEHEIVVRDPFLTRGTPRDPGHAPTPAQRAAIDTLAAAAPGSVALVLGITGSGKTLVYIELLKEIVDRRGKTAIVLVPEIALTPQTVDRFRAVFGDRVAVLHSALSDGERYDAWVAIRSGAKRIVVGPRSAVFAPLANLGAIIVDEEHESSYKQADAPRYHAREVAIVRARQAGAITVLGSATPSLESWVLAQQGQYTLITLPDRVGGGSLPPVEVVDRRTPSGTPASPASVVPVATYDGFRGVISEPLEDALRDRITKGEQSILLLNRRGFASFIQCIACGDVATCPNCSISLTLHRSPARLVCHYCTHTEPPRERCIRCGEITLRNRGLGTQQVERLLGERFPDARIARMDVDTTSGKWAHATILDRVAAGDVDILLGTQMIAKGLDFPNVTLVGVIDADVGINLPDFRASERCFQLLSQVAGRAGRGPKGGRVIIQTRVPGHHAVRCAATHDYAKFVSQELDGRKHPLYPPMTRIARVVVSATDENAAHQHSERAAEWLRELATQRASGTVTVIGPAPCPVERIKNRFRWHVLLKSDDRDILTRVAGYFMRRFKVPATDELRVILDRDPVALL